MKEFSRKRKLRSMRYSWWVALLMTLLLVLVSVSSLRMWKSYRYARDYLHERNTEQAELQKNYEELAQDVQLLNTREGLEEVLREKYRATKPGENVIILLDQK